MSLTNIIYTINFLLILWFVFYQNKNHRISLKWLLLFLLIPLFSFVLYFFLGKGISLNKYTGARGKSMASDANAEYVAWIRNLLNKNDIKYQVAELGKVDIGGGGTIAYILANKGVDVIDCGVPVLSMHAPYEVTSKFDIYSAYKTYKAFWQE